MGDATLHELAELVRSGGSLPDDAVRARLSAETQVALCAAKGVIAGNHMDWRLGFARRIVELCAVLAASEVLRLDAEATLAAVRAYATAERPSIPKCLDPGHDDRWCSHCDSMMDGVGHAQARVLRILDVEAPDA